MSTIDTRREQMFPKLEPGEIDRLRRFGQVRRYAAGEALFVTGEIAPGMYVLIKGSVRVIRRDPLGHSAPIVEQWALRQLTLMPVEPEIERPAAIPLTRLPTV